jgi:hypothetical protein
VMDMVDTIVPFLCAGSTQTPGKPKPGSLNAWIRLSDWSG